MLQWRMIVPVVHSGAFPLQGDMSDTHAWHLLKNCPMGPFENCPAVIKVEGPKVRRHFLRVHFTNGSHWLLPCLALETSSPFPWTSADRMWTLSDIFFPSASLHDLVSPLVDSKRRRSLPEYPFFHPSILLKRFPALWERSLAFPINQCLFGTGAACHTAVPSDEVLL